MEEIAGEEGIIFEEMKSGAFSSLCIGLYNLATFS